MEKIKNLEKALNAVGIQTTLEQFECRTMNHQLYRVLELELKNTCDSDGEPYSFIFHPTTYQLIDDFRKGEQIKETQKSKKLKKW